MIGAKPMAWIFAVIAMVAVAGLLIVSLAKPYSERHQGSHQFSPPTHNDTKNQTGCAIGDSYWERFVCYVETRDKFFTAFGTLVIAGFTVCLALATAFLYVATRELLEGADKTAERQLRAYVGVDSIVLEIPSFNDPNYVKPTLDGGPAIFKDFVLPTIKNYGQTPAHDVSTYVSVVGISIPGNPSYAIKLPEDFSFEDVRVDKSTGKERVVSKSILQPGRADTTKVPLDDIKGVKEAHDLKITLYAYGHVDYTDIYDRRWTNVFCFLYEPWRPEGSRFIPYERNNYEKQIN